MHQMETGIYLVKPLDDMPECLPLCPGEIVLKQPVYVGSTQRFNDPFFKIPSIPGVSRYQAGHKPRFSINIKTEAGWIDHPFFVVGIEKGAPWTKEDIEQEFQCQFSFEQFGPPPVPFFGP